MHYNFQLKPAKNIALNPSKTINNQFKNTTPIGNQHRVNY